MQYFIAKKFATLTVKVLLPTHYAHYQPHSGISSINVSLTYPSRNLQKVFIFLHRQRNDHLQLYNPRKTRAQPFLTVKFLLCEYFSTFQSALSGVPFLLSFQTSYFLEIKVSNGLQGTITYPQNTVAYQFGEENEMR